MKAIGIDIGTTTISGIVMEIETKEMIKALTLPNQSFLTGDHSWERIQDTEVILKAAMKMLEDFRKEYPDIACIGITGQMHGILYLDAQGNAVSPLYTWQDARAEQLLSDGETVLQKAGKIREGLLFSGYGLATHLYHVKTEQVPEKAVTLCTIGDYLAMKLTGRTAPLMHSSNAASLGCYDLDHNQFYIEVLKQLEIPSEFLPEITEDPDLVGTWENIPVISALGDNQASFLGSVGAKENTLLLNMGTGGQISIMVDEPLRAAGVETRPILKGKYLLVGASLCGGRAYAILENFLEETLDGLGNQKVERNLIYAQMEKMAEAAWKAQKERESAFNQNGDIGQIQNVDSHILKVDTRFQGTRLDPAVRGSVTQIGENNFHPGELILGALKGMTEELYEMYLSMEIGAAVKGKNLQIAGAVGSGNGLRRNAMLRKIMEEQFNTRLVMAEYAEEAAYGAACFACMKK